MGKKDDSIEVQAVGTIKHGDGKEVTEYNDGDRFIVSLVQAKQLYEAGAIVKPGTKPDDTTKQDKAAAKVEAKIDDANAKAAAEAEAAAGKA